MKPIILASTSPRRKKLLEQIGITCKVVPSNYKERFNPRLKPRGQAEFLAREKAKAVADKFQDQDVIIIAADQVIDLNGEVLGKPKSLTDAEHMLRRLSGIMHSVITAYTIIDTQNMRTFTRAIETRVYFKKLTQHELAGYIATKEPLGHAGSYGIDSIGSVLVERIEGDFYNVVGLPVAALTEDLKRFGISIF